MIEILLVLSLLGNGWLFYDKGELEHSNEQLQQVVEEQNNLIGEHYVKVGELEEQLGKAEVERERIITESSKRAIELEKLRNRDSSVDSYLNERIPASVVEHLQAHSKG